MADNVVIYYVGWHGTTYEANLLSGTYWGVPSMDRLGARRRALDWAGIPWKDWPHGEPANMDEFGVELVIGDSRSSAGRLGEVLDRIHNPGAGADQFQYINEKLDRVLGALNITPAPSPPPSIPDTYTVVGGDTLSGIAAKYGLSKDDLAAWNSIADQNNIGIGQVLKLHP